MIKWSLLINDGEPYGVRQNFNADLAPLKLGRNGLQLLVRESRRDFTLQFCLAGK